MSFKNWDFMKWQMVQQKTHRAYRRKKISPTHALVAGQKIGLEDLESINTIEEGLQKADRRQLTQNFVNIAVVNLPDAIAA